LNVLLEFALEHQYQDDPQGIHIPVRLSTAEQKVELLAKVDTGAACCIFERRYAELLGLEVESGRPQRIRTVTGEFDTYGHEVTLETFGIQFSSVVYFARLPEFNRNFVGRDGWLTKLRIALVDYDRQIHLSPYDQ